MRAHEKLRALAGALCLLFLYATSVSSQQDRSLRITAFEANYEVAANGTLTVTEHITAAFTGHWNGLFRTIPVRYHMDNGTDYTVGLTLLSARDEQGHDLTKELSRDHENIEIKAWIPGAEDATHTLTLRYVVTDALRFFNEHDELYWNVTGNAWEFPLESVRASVVLPHGVSGIRAVAYTGMRGSQATDATVVKGTSGASFATTRPLDLHEGMTIVVGWNPGVIKRPTKLDKLVLFARSNILLMIPILILIIMLLLWYRFGRDPSMGAIVTLYEPPEGKSPGELGTIVDGTVDSRDITATLVDLAVRGHIVIHEPQPTTYSISRVNPAPADKLRSHEELMMSGLFEDGKDSVTMDDLTNKFYKTRSKMTTDLLRCVTGKGYYRRSPAAVIGFFVLGAFAVFVAIQLWGQVLGAQYGLSSDDVMISAVASALIIICVGWAMPARTMKGVMMVRQVLGFQEFLSRVEGERMQKMIDRPELFEKFLPYAIALGVDKQWARKFDGLTMPPPTWYAGSYDRGFHPVMFVNDVNTMSTSVGRTMASSPRSDSSSGSGSGFSSGGGGGGFSGGGFGGGGGGGF